MAIHDTHPHLGLRRDAVRLAEHEAAWLELGAEECARLAAACGRLAVAIEHAGSTAVPELVAKPVLDIVVGLASARHVPQLIEPLRRLGYAYLGTGEGAGGDLFALETEPEVSSVHVHAVAHGGPQWRSHVAFRDRLRADAVLRADYARLKLEIAAMHVDQRRSYAAAKARFIQRALL